MDLLKNIFRELFEDYQSYKSGSCKNIFKELFEDFQSYKRGSSREYFSSIIRAINVGLLKIIFIGLLEL